eukprot:gene14385-761_t
MRLPAVIMTLRTASSVPVRVASDLPQSSVSGTCAAMRLPAVIVALAAAALPPRGAAEPPPP